MGILQTKNACNFNYLYRQRRSIQLSLLCKYGSTDRSLNFAGNSAD